jgi:hypothetical protein
MIHDHIPMILVSILVEKSRVLSESVPILCTNMCNDPKAGKQ